MPRMPQNTQTKGAVLGEESGAITIAMIVAMAKAELMLESTRQTRSSSHIARPTSRTLEFWNVGFIVVFFESK